MRSVHVGVGHQNDFPVPNLGGIEIILGNAGAQRGDHGANFLVRQHLVVAGFFDVENLALQRQNRLESPVASLLRRSTSGLALNQKQFAAIRIALRAIRQLPWQTAGIQRAFSPG